MLSAGDVGAQPAPVQHCSAAAAATADGEQDSRRQSMGHAARLPAEHEQSDALADAVPMGCGGSVQQDIASWDDMADCLVRSVRSFLVALWHPASRLQATIVLSILQLLNETAAPCPVAAWGLLQS